MKKHSGFTLIELMIAVAVIVTLATIAIPAYNSFVQKSARSDAMAALMDVRLKQEQHRLSNTTYAGNVVSLPLDLASYDADELYSPNKKYLIKVTAADAASFTATATPQGSQANDTDCGTFAINQNGPDTTGSYADDGCWKR